jgi:AAA domain
MVAANARIKLDDLEWQTELIDLGHIRPRLYVFDPVARMKSAIRKENEQAEMGVLVDFFRLLRDETGAAVCFVQHTGHVGAHMRGTSDLETVWESRLAWSRDGQSPILTLHSEHREAEASDPIKYRIAWDGSTRSMRFDLTGDKLPSLADRLLEALREHGPATTDELRKRVGVRKSDVLRTLEALEQAGTTHRGRSGRRDQLGREKHDKAWKLSSHAEPVAVPR